MNVITERRLREAAQSHPNAAKKIEHWNQIARKAAWESIDDVRATFPHADPVKVSSGKTITVFNLAKDFRLITAIHYDRKRIYILEVLTHAEYNKDKWKERL